MPELNNEAPASYDADMLADARAAFDEVSKGAEVPAETAAEPEVREVAEAAPVEPKADHPTDEKRYADGTFKPQKTTEEKPVEVKAEEKPKEPEPEPGLSKEIVRDGQSQVAGNPPPGWSVKSKSEWDKLPEHIRADILKREKEVNDGFAQYEGMRELRPYVDQARSQGQTLKQILDSFIGMENLLRQNPEQGFLHIASRLGIQPQRLASAFAGYLGPTNGQPAQPGFQQSEYQPQFDPTSLMQQWLNPLQQQVQEVKTLFQQQQEAALSAVVQRFTADPAHRFFENVEPRMAQLINGGVIPKTGDYWTDLKNAYDAACRMDPEINEILINEKIAKSEEARKQQEKEAAEKAKLASRSITGSPSTGPSKDADDKGGDSIEDDVRRAYRAHAA